MNLLLVDIQDTIIQTRSGKPEPTDPMDQKGILGARERLSEYKTHEHIIQGVTVLPCVDERVTGENCKTQAEVKEALRYALALHTTLTGIYYATYEDLALPSKFMYLTLENEQEYVINHRVPRYALETMLHIAIADSKAAMKKDETLNHLYVSHYERNRAIANNAKINFMWAEQWRSIYITDLKAQTEKYKIVDLKKKSGL